MSTPNTTNNINNDDFESNKYICILNKRLRTLKKKCRHIDDLKVVNRKLTQTDLVTIESENNIKANINELEKLKLLLIEAAIAQVCIFYKLHLILIIFLFIKFILFIYFRTLKLKLLLTQNQKLNLALIKSLRKLQH